MDKVDYKLANLALREVSWQDFEKFVHVLCPVKFGEEYIPLGGSNDGGADGCMGEGICESKNKPERFIQISMQKDHRGKILASVKRIKAVGRNIRQLIYISSRVVNRVDLLEQELSDETGVNIKIRDREWIVSKINDDDRIIQAFNSYLMRHVDYLINAGTERIAATLEEGFNNRAIYVFLSQEVERREPNGTLIESIADSCIFWALQETNPDEDKFLTKEQICEKIYETLPAAKNLINNNIAGRLDVLRLKGSERGREVNYHPDGEKYCLPHKTRKAIKQKDSVDELLRLKVKDKFEEEAHILIEKYGYEIDVVKVAELMLDIIHEMVKEHGMDFAAFVNGEDTDMQSNISSTLIDNFCALNRVKKQEVEEIIYPALNNQLSVPAPDVKEYYGKLSRIYALLFSLKADINVAKYLDSMSSEFRLYVGTDIIVKALSERYFKGDDKVACNMLDVMNRHESKLILAEPVLEELVAHLYSTNNIYDSNREEVEVFKNISCVNKELIHAYFNAKNNENLASNKRPKNWADFIAQFCDYESVKHGNKIKCKNDLKMYLIDKFNMIYIDNEQVDRLCNNDDVNNLAAIIYERKGSMILSRSDARIIMSVYGERASMSINSKSNVFGYKTWWLTQETGILHSTVDLVRKNGTEYIMKPEFILNMIVYRPSVDDVRKSYDKVISSTLFMKLANRMRDEPHDNLIGKIKEASSVELERAGVKS